MSISPHQLLKPHSKNKKGHHGNWCGDIYVVIMAGGSGKRFWPKSTKENPKQFLAITGKESMLQQTVKRLKGIVQRKNIIIVTNTVQAKIVKKQLPWISSANVIAEPFSKNTAPCVGVAAARIYKKDPSGVMIVLPADHVIKDEVRFRKTLLDSAKYAMKEKVLVTLGILPNCAHTGYGYIRLGKRTGKAFHQVHSFVEKPDVKTAKKYLKSGKYRWNSGMFIWRVDTILEEMKKLMPGLYKLLFKPSLVEIYKKAKDVSIDYGIMEKTRRAVVREADFKWDDVGNWAALEGYFKKDKNGNVIQGKFISKDTKDSIIIGDSKLIATAGVSNMIIVATEDAILICPKDKAQDVKYLADLAQKVL